MKIVNDRLFRTLVSALPFGIVSVDVPSPFVVPGVANTVEACRRLVEDLFKPCAPRMTYISSGGNY